MLYIRELKIFIKNAFYNDKKKTIFQKWKQSLLAILVALIFSSILIAIKGQNPFLVFKDIVLGAIRNGESLKETFIYFALFAIAGSSIIIGFKSGLFNIGIAGQMLISGSIIMVLAIKFSLPWPLLLIIGMLIAAICASISGILKSIFNIHEVVSTILLNWVFFYISQYILSNDMSWMNGSGSTNPISDSSRIMIGESIALPAILIAGIIIVFSILLFTKTKWGFALKSVGQNIDASKYAGIKITTQMMLGMALSGMAAGALAAINYLGKFGSMAYSTSTSLPSIGFQGISVALISFNSLLGLIPAAFFWAILTFGADYASIIHPEVPKEIISLMNGLIIYSIAISIIFIRFRPISIIIKWINRIRSKEIQDEIHKIKESKTKQIFLFSKRKQEIVKLKIEDKKIYQEINLLKSEYIHNKKMILKIILNYYKIHYKILIKIIFIKKHRDKFNLDLFNKRNELDKKNDKINKNIIIFKTNLTKNNIKTNKKQLKDGLSILEKEHKSKINGINEKIISESWFGNLVKKYKLSKAQNYLFNSKYNLLKLNFKENLKSIKTIEDNIIKKQKRDKLIKNFNLKVNKLQNNKGAK